MKLALVVQRYGRQVAGGSEAHCREIAERLAEHHDVTVLTSCARDYITWRNEYSSGSESINGVRVLRFRSHRRRMHRFREISEYVFSGDGSAQDERQWFEENGPRVPGLLKHLEQEGHQYDRVMFWTFRYYPSFFGLPLVADKAVLLPTAEEDPAVELSVLSDYFKQPRGLLFLTPEEAELVGRAVNGSLPKFDVIGSGLDEPHTERKDHSEAPARTRELLADIGVQQPFALYLGRVDPNKGCETLLRYYQRYCQSEAHPIDLVLAGNAVMQVPQHPNIKALGFVSEALREALLEQTQFLVMPSPFESLSMVLLEAWNHRRPALVNGCCKVLKGQLRRASGGLYYGNFPEFREAMRWLHAERDMATKLGQQGRDYVDQNYRWPTVIAKIERMLNSS